GYTLLLEGHSHEYYHLRGSNEVISGNGGAPLNGSHYGLLLIEQLADGNLSVSEIDEATGNITDNSKVSPGGQPVSCRVSRAAYPPRHETFMAAPRSVSLHQPLSRRARMPRALHRRRRRSPAPHAARKPYLVVSLSPPDRAAERQLSLHCA